jgi:nucleotide-binding universal stress UspA family protein
LPGQSDTDADSVGHCVCNKADDIQATLVVIPSQDRSSVSELLLGSVTQHVLHRCKRPVLVAKGV